MEHNMTEYSFEVSPVDLHVALDCEGKRAESEGFNLVAKRQKDNALHVRNALRHMEKICPEGYRVETRITFVHVPNVNPFLSDEARS
jgi:aspartate aminotransferase-like enzyme